MDVAFPRHTDGWPVLVISSGSPHAALGRGIAAAVLTENGFPVETWDRPGYRAEPRIDPLEACVQRARSAAITVALLDWDEGSELPRDRLSGHTQEWLLQKQILLPRPAVDRSVTQVELLAAIETDQPVIVLVPDGLLREAAMEIERVAAMASTYQPKVPDAPSAEELVASRRFLELLGYYAVPSGDRSVRQAAFLLEIQPRVYIQKYREGHPEDIQNQVKLRLVTLSAASPKSQLRAIETRLRRKRNPLDTRSLHDLQEAGLLVPPAYHADSGSDLLEGRPLLASGTDESVLLELVDQGRNVLILAEPGMGKTTTALLSARSILEARSGSGSLLLFLSLKTLPAGLASDDPAQMAELWIREALGELQLRQPWPGPIEGVPLRLVIDGLDEAPLSNADMETLLRHFAQRATILATCRRADYERGLHAAAGLFDVIIELDPWGDRELETYCSALRQNGAHRAAAYIERNKTAERRLLALPLWLACLVYLAERDAPRIDPGQDDYALLMSCGELLAIEECRSSGLAATDADDLTAAWGTVAWQENYHNRRGEALELSTLLTMLGVQDSLPWKKAVLSQVEERNGLVTGFHHDVFRDYWLAHHIANALRPGCIPEEEIGGLLATQRTPFANKLIRARLADNPGPVARRLRKAFEVSADPWAQNQILYLLGRIDHGDATKGFMRRVWQGDSHRFVRYSAAWVGSLAGDILIESEFFTELSCREALDELNRAYHRLYYDDSRLATVEVPELDDGGPADNAMTQLARRIGDNEMEHEALRRVEMFTLLRFLESRGAVVSSVVADIRQAFARGVSAPEHQAADVERLREAIESQLVLR